jgi:N-acetylglucosaminyl-diphospho-decaprenol L-rhamnosyltransferase
VDLSVETGTRDHQPGAEHSIDVTIVIVTHESRHDIAACLQSLETIDDRCSREIIVVDNASDDGTAVYVRANHPEVSVLTQTVRRGFSANTNLGAAHARGRHLFVLNPDTVVPSGVIDRLLDHLDANSDVGLVGPRLVYPDGSPQYAARRFPSPMGTAVRRTPLRHLLPAVADRHLVRDLGRDSVDDVDWMLGAALLIRGTAFRELHGFDEGYRLYCEDIDLCWRLHEQGWRVQHVGDVAIMHALRELTTRRFLTRRTIWHLRSVVRFIRLHGIAGRPRAR